MNTARIPRGLYWDVIRPGFIGAIRRVGSWTYHVAPRVVRAAEQVCYDAYDSLSWSQYTRPIVVPCSIGKVRFELSVVSDHRRAQRQYVRLSKTREVYEPVMVACLTRILERAREPVFMDVGAFMGYYACYVSALLRDRKPVFAIESNPRYAEAIRASCRLNGFQQLHVHSVALSDRTAMVGIEGEAVVPDGGGALQMASLTMDELCRREGIGPTVLKMDVHGAEGMVVRGMPHTLATSVEHLLIEVHPVAVLDRYSPGVTRLDLLDLLESAGLTLYYVSGHRHRSRGSGEHELPQAGGFSYRRLDRASRDLLLFDRLVDIFLLATRHDDIETLLGPSAAVLD